MLGRWTRTVRLQHVVHDRDPFVRETGATVRLHDSLHRRAFEPAENTFGSSRLEVGGAHQDHRTREGRHVDVRRRHLDTVLDQHDTELLIHRKGTPRLSPDRARAGRRRSRQVPPCSPSRTRAWCSGRPGSRSSAWGSAVCWREDLAGDEQLILDRAGPQVERRRARVGTERDRTGDDHRVRPRAPDDERASRPRACREVREHVRTLGVGRRGQDRSGIGDRHGRSRERDAVRP